jgi:hypothetical protein
MVNGVVAESHLREALVVFVGYVGRHRGPQGGGSGEDRMGPEEFLFEKFPQGRARALRVGFSKFVVSRFVDVGDEEMALEAVRFIGSLFDFLEFDSEALDLFGGELFFFHAYPNIEVALRGLRDSGEAPHGRQGINRAASDAAGEIGEGDIRGGNLSFDSPGYVVLGFEVENAVRHLLGVFDVTGNAGQVEVDKRGKYQKNLFVDIVEFRKDCRDFPLVVIDIGPRADGDSPDHFLVFVVEFEMGRSVIVIVIAGVGWPEDVVVVVPVVLAFFSRRIFSKPCLTVSGKASAGRAGFFKTRRFHLAPTS